MFVDTSRQSTSVTVVEPPKERQCLVAITQSTHKVSEKPSLSFVGVAFFVRTQCSVTKGGWALERSMTYSAFSSVIAPKRGNFCKPEMANFAKKMYWNPREDSHVLYFAKMNSRDLILFHCRHVRAGVPLSPNVLHVCNLYRAIVFFPRRDSTANRPLTCFICIPRYIRTRSSTRRGFLFFLFFPPPPSKSRCASDDEWGHAGLLSQQQHV